MKNNQNNSDQKFQIPNNQAETLAVIGGLFLTIGSGLQTLAAALEIQEIEQAQAQFNKGNSSEIKKLQRQLDLLTKEVQVIKRMLLERNK